MFIIVKLAICHGNVEKPFHQVDQHLAVIIAKHGANFAGVGIKAGHVLPGKVEHAGGICFLVFAELRDVSDWMAFACSDDFESAGLVVLKVESAVIDSD